MSLRFAGFCAVAFLAASTECVLSCVASPQEEQKALGALAEGYFNNRQAFRAINCRFEVVNTNATTVEDALAARFVGKQMTHYGLWLVNGANTRYELLCAPTVKSAVEEALREKRKAIREERSKGRSESTISVECVDELYLKNDDYYMSYGPLILSANLFSKETARPVGIRKTPFDMGVIGADEISNPGRFLKDCLGGRFVGRFFGTERIGKAELLVTTVECKGFADYKYGFDPNRGYVLAYYASKDNKSGRRYEEAFVTDIKQCSEGRWFPMRSVVISYSDPKAPLAITEFRVVQLDVDHGVAQEEFYLDIAAGTQVSIPGVSALGELQRTSNASALRTWAASTRGVSITGRK